MFESQLALTRQHRQYWSMLRSYAIVSLPIALTIGACTPTGGDGDETGSTGSNTPDLAPLLCQTCLSGGDTTDFGGEPPLCPVKSRRQISRSEAIELGYGVDRFEDLVVKSFSSTVMWRGDLPPAELNATIAVNSFFLVELENQDLSSCKDHLSIELNIDVSTTDSSLHGSLAGETAIANKGALTDPLLVTLFSWPSDLRGWLPLHLDELGPPQALHTRFDLLITQGDKEPRLGLELLGLYSFDPKAGDLGYTTTIQQASPPDGCPAFTTIQGDNCDNAPLP